MTEPASGPTAMVPAKIAEIDTALHRLDASKALWKATPTAERLALLKRIRAGVLDQADAWVEAALRLKALPADSPLAGEEWSSPLGHADHRGPAAGDPVSRR